MIQEEQITGEVVEKLLQNLVDSFALELHFNDVAGEVWIPYIMNDAVECYLRLEECRVHGKYEKAEDQELEITFAETEKAKGIFLRQYSGNVVSIWYQRAIRVVKNCQYHLIGHNWRKQPGEEVPRRLMNLICVLHDKVSYLEERFWSQEEKALAMLAEFSPCRYYTPINESILDWYPDSREGIEAARSIALSAKDLSLYEELGQYEILYEKGKIKERQIYAMAERLMQKEHARFWKELSRQLEQASKAWEPRDYGITQNQNIQRMREQAAEKYREQGYVGEYPLLTLGQSDDRESKTILFVEEHPFTVMEAKEFHYRIFSMTLQDPYLHGEYLEEISWENEKAKYWP